MTNKDIVTPTRSAKMKDAKAAIPPSRAPIRGIHLRKTIIGVNIVHRPITASKIPITLVILVDHISFTS